MKKNFFEWITECCRLMGKDTKYGVLLCEDTNWVSAWSDGLTEEEAIKEWRVVYPDGYPKEIEDEFFK